MKKFVILAISIISCTSSDNSKWVSNCSLFALCKDNYIHAYASDQFTLDERIDLQRSFSAWEEVANVNRNVLLFHLEFVQDQYLQRSASVNNTFFIYRQAPQNKNYTGYTQWEYYSLGAIIDLKPEVYNLKPVALHEIGHALHMEHYLGKEPSIMRPGVKVDQIEQVDKDQFNSLWGN